jgi:hypothetical protein
MTAMCAKCGKDKTHYARGLCPNCYGYHQRTRTLDAYSLQAGPRLHQLPRTWLRDLVWNAGVSTAMRRTGLARAAIQRHLKAGTTPDATPNLDPRTRWPQLPSASATAWASCPVPREPEPYGFEALGPTRHPSGKGKWVWGDYYVYRKRTERVS